LKEKEKMESIPFIDGKTKRKKKESAEEKPEAGKKIKDVGKSHFSPFYENFFSMDGMTW